MLREGGEVFTEAFLYSAILCCLAGLEVFAAFSDLRASYFF